MKNIKGKIFAFVLGLLCGILILFGVSQTNLLNNLFTEKTEITSTEIKSQIVGLNELATLSYEYTNVGSFENSISVFGYQLPLTTKKFILTYDGRVKMGVDLDDVSVEVKDNKVYITVPSAQILSNEIFQDSFEIYDEKNSIFNSFELEDYSTFEVSEKEKVVDKIKKEGYLNDARNRAIESITELLTPLLGEEYELIFR